ncbi:SAM-dependent methyltransferase [Anoxybacter fermentans]|uniref:SAM-dependent methyltransferase n=1 Tax=Anoxybacter fermentans TaxID=1323375 RepID=A0A3Q9HRD6_9FIRM|nr:class I SAM-dependent rRNA methyltransferase [Anoxybacter fermentans]AZR73832.1 SAM-dependent methyltransferase [Anoxybacter fermentans]
MTNVILRKRKNRRIENGHPWIYDNEILKIEGEVKPGDIVNVLNHARSFIGRGYINPNSKIRIRLLTREDEEIDRNFFRRRITRAWEYRKRFYDTSSCRVIFGEADFLPGLIVDKFGDYLVIQTLALGIDQYKEMIVELLDEIIQPKGIYERNDVPVRELEGLPQKKGFLKGEFDTVVEIEENGIRMLVDLAEGQKTGYFLDQKENRAAIEPLVRDALVLDCFCHTGAFTLHALHYGAREVTAVDISEQAIDFVKKNVALNGYEDRVKYEVANAFDLLREYADRGEKFDVVILDPPAFCKSRSAIEGAKRGYKEINLRGMKIVKPGGFLVTASCSHYMYPEIFTEVILDAAADAGKQLRLVEYRYQSKDHPILMSYRESLYLKFFIYQVF